MENPPLYSFVYFMLPYFSTCSSTCQEPYEHLFVFWINKQIRPHFFVRPAQKEKPHVSFETWCFRLSIKSQTGKSKRKWAFIPFWRIGRKTRCSSSNKSPEIVAAQRFCLTAQTPPYRTLCTPTGGVCLSLCLS